MATIPIQTQIKSKKPAKTERHYTVSYVPNRGDTSTPALNLSGKWLRAVGFETGTSVTVKIAGDCIVLIPETEGTVTSVWSDYFESKNNKKI